ncbi:hypothetical protein AM228_14535 [Planktothricoides sp. SR001]|uniref:EVE domain-containing protein n=1 Tax=Planktothricoides sp. SR001 TaxID=1705388 RepID=UPI0006C6C143|nr:EVE domain-containing protein [Planktothricoides sp. SR001]KOR36108.1 hypothetical protein AM228_14535 [Planktothricoides sp. SR001]
MAYWLFQGNPKYYKVTQAIQDFEEMLWLVTRYGKEIAVGDEVIIWMAGNDAGIYAIAEIIEPAQFRSEVSDRDYWLDKTRIGIKPQAKIRFTKKFLEKPLLRSTLKEDPLLQKLLVIRAPNSTNYKMNSEEWQAVMKLLSVK